MSNEQLQLLALIYANQAYVLGMQAENACREARGDSPAWNYADFSRQATELEELANRARHL